MTEAQQLALQFHCRLAIETMHPRFAAHLGTHSQVVTVDSGYG